MVAVAHRSWSFIRGSNCKALTGKVLVFWISGRFSEVVAHGGSTAVRISLLPGWGGHLGLIVMHLFKAVLYSQRSLSHAVLRLGTDSLVLLMNALKAGLDGWRKRERQRKEYQALYLYYNASQDR